MKKNLQEVRYIVFALIFLSLAFLTQAQEENYLKLSKKYFNELDSICSIDNGKLWGINLYGPTMLVIPEKKLMIANIADKNNLLKPNDGLFVGILPDNLSIANTSIEWSGINWTMVMWNSISENDPYGRRKLFVHESWHRVQNDIGVKSVMTANSHLDELQGSILFKLEILALKNALIANETTEKETNLKNALTIRTYRHLLFPNNNENEFERHEGMAEYTGYKLCGINENIIPKLLSKQIDFYLNKEGLANSFAYLTGPAYGFLLDELNFQWIEQIHNGQNLPEIVSQKLNLQLYTDTSELKCTIDKLLSFYNAESFVENETKKFSEQDSLVNKYRQKFITGNQLIILNSNLNFSFNPQEKLIPIDNLGVVYKTIRITGEWGILEVSNGIFRSNNWQYFIISAPKSSFTGVINEPDYKLTLNAGWEIIKSETEKYFIKLKE